MPYSSCVSETQIQTPHSLYRNLLVTMSEDESNAKWVDGFQVKSEAVKISTDLAISENTLPDCS
jgi:hypothetical protein